MGKIWILLIALSIFLVITLLYWTLTREYAKKEYGKKMWKQWTTRTFYWTGALWFSGGSTVLAIFLLKWANVLHS